jgi:hypothetical protein
MVQVHWKIGNGELQTRLPVSGFWGRASIPQVEVSGETSMFISHPHCTRSRRICVTHSTYNQL